MARSMAVVQARHLLRQSHLDKDIAAGARRGYDSMDMQHHSEERLLV